MKIKNKLLLGVMMCSLAACTEQPQTPASAPEASAPADTAAPTAAAPRTVAESLSDSAHLLTVKPGAIDRCTATDGVIAVEVSWDVTSVKSEGVHVYLQNVGEQPKLWSTAGPVGKDMTGKWLQNGATVILQGSNNQELAKVTLNDVACP